MLFSTEIYSPLGILTAVSDGTHINGLWFNGQKYFMEPLPEKPVPIKDSAIFTKLRNWLDRYFAGQNPPISDLPLKPFGSSFRKKVWNALCEISYGEMTTYGAIARKIAPEMGRSTMSAQAVGGAVGHNPISIIIPCHRVLGADGSLTGYAGGLDKKIQLLKIEGYTMKNQKRCSWVNLKNELYVKYHDEE